MKEILQEAVLKIAGNTKTNVSLNLNDSKCLQPLLVFGAIGGLVTGIVCIGKKDWSHMGAAFVTSLTCTGAYLGINWLDNKKTDKQYCHEEKVKEIMHPKRNFASNDGENSAPLVKRPFRSPKLPPVLPPILQEIVYGAPKGYEEAFLMSSLSMLGALCISRVRAKRDNKLQEPNLQVVVSGPSGQGKGKIMDMYRTYFSRFIERDRTNFNNGVHIIQTSGINYSEPKLYEILNNMQGLHMFVVEPEISSVTQTLKKSSTGFDYDTLRNAFDGAEVTWSTRHQMFRGNLLLNFVFTGTDKTVEKFLAGHIEDGTANRIIHATIPKTGRELPSITYPNNLEAIKDNFDMLHSKYCFSTDANDNEIVAPIHVTNLDYVNEALDKWVDDQYSKHDHQEMRRSRRARVATIAFHAAIIAHMLCDEPREDEPLLRGLVVDLALFIADYTMERYIYDFDDTTPRAKGTPADWIRRHESVGHQESWKQIAASEGKTPEAVRKAVYRHKKKHK